MLNPFIIYGSVGIMHFLYSIMLFMFILSKLLFSVIFLVMSSYYLSPLLSRLDANSGLANCLLFFILKTCLVIFPLPARQEFTIKNYNFFHSCSFRLLVSYICSAQVLSYTSWCYYWSEHLFYNWYYIILPRNSWYFFSLQICAPNSLSSSSSSITFTEWFAQNDC